MVLSQQAYKNLKEEEKQKQEQKYNCKYDLRRKQKLFYPPQAYLELSIKIS